MEKVIELRTSCARWPAPDPSVPAQWLQAHPDARCKGIDWCGNFALLTVEVSEADAAAIDAELAREAEPVRTIVSPGVDPIPRGKHFVPQPEKKEANA